MKQMSGITQYNMSRGRSFVMNEIGDSELRTRRLFWGLSDGKTSGKCGPLYSPG